MNQMNFADLKARARRTDPAESHAAARTVENRGRADSHRRAILDYVRRHPGRTASEISQALMIDRVAAGKRLPELRQAGLIVSKNPRICEVTGNRCATHYPA